MTQPTEADIRASYDVMHCIARELGYPSILEALEDLARRIAAEREVVPCAVCGIANQNHWIHAAPFHEQCHDYAHPPKEPNDA